jgi:hypothetical protein
MLHMRRTVVRTAPQFFRRFGDSKVSSAVRSDAEYTLSPYADSNDFGYGRGTQYCLLTLKHPAFAGKMDANVLRELYSAKQEHGCLSPPCQFLYVWYDSSYLEQ